MVKRISDKITSELLEGLKGNEEIKVKDTEITGFYAWYYPKTELKTFFIRYFADDLQKDKIVKIGCFPETGVNQAREMAISYKGTLKRDRNKKTRIEEENGFITEDILNKYLTEYSATHKKETTYKIEVGLTKRFLSKEIGRISLQKLDFQTINNLFQKIGEKSPSQANQCRALLSHFLNWCEELNYREKNTNPCNKIKIFKLGKNR